MMGGARGSVDVKQSLTRPSGAFWTTAPRFNRLSARWRYGERVFCGGDTGELGGVDFHFVCFVKGRSGGGGSLGFGLIGGWCGGGCGGDY